MIIKNTLTVKQAIAELEEIELAVEKLNGRKAHTYKLVEVFGFDLITIRQILHYRRELRKGKGNVIVPDATERFLSYLKQVA